MNVMDHAPHDDSAGESVEPNRRHQHRRIMHTDVKGDARGADRRKQKPGIAGLLRDMLGLDNKQC
jgi:hypothetical protein